MISPLNALCVNGMVFAVERNLKFDGSLFVVLGYGQFCWPKMNHVLRIKYGMLMN